MSGFKRNSNHLSISEPQAKIFKFNTERNFPSYNFNTPVEIRYTPNPQSIKIEREMTQFMDKLQSMQKQIINLERQLKFKLNILIL